MADGPVHNAKIDETGWTMPAQWANHTGTLLAYPFDDDLWFGRLEQVRREYDQLILAIARGEEVLLVIPPGSEKDVQSRPWFELKNVHRILLPLDDVWVRDSGPIFVYPRNRGSASAGLHALDFQFNAWGKKFYFEKDAELGRFVAQSLGAPCHRFDFVFEGGSLEVNGEGLALTTEQCLLEPSRNPGWTKSSIEKLLMETLSLESIIWLEQGLVGDHTDGHIDTLTRFVNSSTVVTLIAEDRAHPSYDILKKNMQTLEKAATGSRGGIQNIVPLPIAKRLEIVDGELIPFTYANFYFANDALLVPQFGEDNDQKAIEILAGCVKDRPVKGIPCAEIVRGGGVINCLTQQIPASRGFSLEAALRAVPVR